MTQSTIRIKVINNTFLLPNESGSRIHRSKSPTISQIKILNKSNRPSAKVFRNNSPDLESSLNQARFSSKSPKLLAPLSTVHKLKQEILSLKSQISALSQQNQELRKSTKSLKSLRIISLKSELSSLKSHHKSLKSKVKTQLAQINSFQPPIPLNSSELSQLKSEHDQKAHQYKVKLAHLHHEIQETSDSIKSFSRCLSEKQKSCRLKLLKIKAELRKKRNFSPSPK